MTPVRYDEHDGADLARVLGSQDDPLVMYLVAPRRPIVPSGELLADAALAAVHCVQRLGSDPVWADAFAEWERSSFRKVCLRARAAELERARALAHSEAGEVLCFPPRRRSAAEPELARLQAHVGGPLRVDDNGPQAVDSRSLLLLIREELQLTAGKACAQVAHGVLIARQLHRPEALRRWERDGSLVAVALVDRDCFERVKSDLAVVAVRDAGIT